jgi:hypothetical protein
LRHVGAAEIMAGRARFKEDEGLFKVDLGDSLDMISTSLAMLVLRKKLFDP